jgi:hypothetical protein
VTDPTQAPSKEMLSLLNDAQAFVGKSRCSLGHSVSAVQDNAKAGRCSYCKHQFELYERLGRAFQSAGHEPPADCVSPERLHELHASCVFQSETGGHADGYVAFLCDLAQVCAELQSRRASQPPPDVLARVQDAMLHITKENYRQAYSILQSIERSAPTISEQP